MTIITRRNVLQGIIAAPAVIAVERLMKVKLWVPNVVKPLPMLYVATTDFATGFVVVNKAIYHPPLDKWVLTPCEA